MYRIIIISILCVIHKNVLAAFDDDLTPEQKEMMANLHKTCVDESGVTEDMINAARKGNFAEDKTLKCYMKCLLTTFGLLDDDGTFDFEAFIDLLPANMQDVGKKIAANCQDSGKDASDICEKAFLLNKCNYDQDPSRYILF